MSTATTPEGGMEEIELYTPVEKAAKLLGGGVKESDTKVHFTGEVTRASDICVDGKKEAWKLSADAMLLAAKQVAQDIDNITFDYDARNPRASLENYAKLVNLAAAKKLHGTQNPTRAQLKDTAELINVFRNGSGSEYMPKKIITELTNATLESTILPSTTQKGFYSGAISAFGLGTPEEAGQKTIHDLRTQYNSLYPKNIFGKRRLKKRITEAAGLEKITFAEFVFIARNAKQLDNGQFVSAQFRTLPSIPNFIRHEVKARLDSGETIKLLEFHSSAAPTSKKRFEEITKQTGSSSGSSSLTYTTLMGAAVEGTPIEKGVIDKIKASAPRGVSVVVSPSKLRRNVSEKLRIFGQAIVASGGKFAIGCKSGKDRTGIVTAIMGATAVMLWNDPVTKKEILQGLSKESAAKETEIQRRIAECIQNINLSQELSDPKKCTVFVDSFLSQIRSKNLIANANTPGSAGLQTHLVYQLDFVRDATKKALDIARKQSLPEAEVQKLESQLGILTEYVALQKSSKSLAKTNKFASLAKGAREGLASRLKKLFSRTSTQESQTSTSTPPASTPRARSSGSARGTGA